MFRNIIKKTIAFEDMEGSFYPLIRNSVFHFTTFEKLQNILEAQKIFHSGYSSELKTTSIHSHESMGGALKAVCLFDLREKSDEQIAPGKSYYDFLKGEPGSQLVYILINPEFYSEVMTPDDVDEALKESRMYLPCIESWFVGGVSLSKVSMIYVIEIN